MNNPAWMLVASLLLTTVIGVVGWFIKDKLSGISHGLSDIKQSTERLRADLQHHIDREVTMLRHMIDEVEKEGMGRDEGIRASLSDLAQTLPREYVMRQEFEKRMDAWQDMMRDVKAGVDRINRRLDGRQEQL